MSSEEDLSRDEGSLEVLRSQILDCLDGIHSAGSFAMADYNVEHVHPGLVVNGVGPIRFPLYSDDATALIEVSRQAPFGKGTATVVDETVRRTWEIDGKEVSFKNEAWNRWLQRVVEKVSEGLGIPGGGVGTVQAELYKLLLYEEGAFFQPHKDTEKAKNMFGTLVVCLPGAHTGGGVRLIHGKEERVLETDEWSSYGVSYLAWYSDVSHEVLPVRSGYRFVLTYNLINQPVQTPLSAAIRDIEASQIDRMLSEWDSMPDPPEAMCYVLQHKYTGAKFRLGGLKGDDYYRCYHLDQAARRSNGRFCILLARLQLRVTRVNDETYEEEHEGILRLQDIATLNDTMLQDSLRISKEFVAQGNLYENRKHDEQWGGEHLGNQHANIQQLYHDAVAVIVSWDSMAQFLLGNSPKATRYSDFVRRLLVHLNDEGSENGRDEKDLLNKIITQTCQKHIARQYTDSRKKDAFLGTTAVAAFGIERPELAQAALDAVDESFDTSSFQDLGSLEFERTRDFCTNAFSRMLQLHLVDRGLRAFCSGLSKTNGPDSSNALVAQWAMKIVCDSLGSIPRVSPQDAGAVVQIMATYEEEGLWRRTDAFVRHYVEEDVTFANALLVEIVCYAESNENPRLVEHLIPSILDRALSSFHLQQFSSRTKAKCLPEDYPFSSWPDYDRNEKGNKDACAVVTLYRRLARDDLNKAGQLLRKMANDVATIEEADLARLVVPLLKEIIDITVSQPFEASRFYSQTITTYIEREVGKEPLKPQDWSLPDDIRGCDQSNCAYCAPVCLFLLDPHKEDQTFTVPESDFYNFNRHVPFGYRVNCEYNGAERTVTIIKDLTTWEWRHSSWQDRANRARSTLRSLPEGPLRQCLGDGEYHNLMELGTVTGSSVAATPEYAIEL